MKTILILVFLTVTGSCDSLQTVRNANGQSSDFETFLSAGSRHVTQPEELTRQDSITHKIHDSYSDSLVAIIIFICNDHIFLFL